MVTNLLSNAIKFTEKGVIICSVEVKSDYIQCFVKDSGLGIAEQDLVRIFDKFQQAGDTLTEKPQELALDYQSVRKLLNITKGKYGLIQDLAKAPLFILHFHSHPKTLLVKMLRR